MNRGCCSFRMRGWALLEGAFATVVALPLFVAALGYCYTIYAGNVLDDLVSQNLHDRSEKILQVKKNDGIYSVVSSSTAASDERQRASKLFMEVGSKLEIDSSKVFVETCSFEISINTLSGIYTGISATTCEHLGAADASNLPEFDLNDSTLISPNQTSQAAIPSGAGFLPVGIIVAARASARILPAWVDEMSYQSLTSHVSSISYSRPYAEVRL